MLKNYIKIALRNLLKHKGYSLTNILGLAIGMACCLLVLTYVLDEVSYDKYHENTERIYRLVAEDKARMPIPLAPLLIEHMPEVADAVRIHRGWGPAMSYGDRQFYRRVRFADAQVFDFFDVEFLRGNAQTALQEPYTIVITRETAELFFGDEDPIGKVLTWDDVFDYEVTGVVEVPRNTHFRFNLLASYETVEARGPQFDHQEVLDYWGYHSSRGKYTYLLLPPGYDAVGFGQKVLDLVERHAGRESRELFEKEVGVPYLQPLGDIYLHSHMSDEMSRNGDSVQVYLTAAIGFFILLIACINFTNLATARSVNRSREVGVRKVMGAYRKQLVRQFLGESLLLSLLSLVLALGLAEIALPHFADFVNRQLALNIVDQPLLAAGLLGMILFTGVLAGAYPAFFLSALEPAHMLKAGLGRGGRGAFLRRFLVVFQFAISIGLTVAAVVVYTQLSYMQNKKLGYNKDQIAMLEVDYPGVVEKISLMEEALVEHPDILQTAALRQPPGRRLMEMGKLRPVDSGEEAIDLPILNVEAGFFELFEMEMAAGRPFSRDHEADRRHAVILNRAALPLLGFATPEEALGKTFEYRFDSFVGEAAVVIGVVEDFHYEPLHNAIGPLFMTYHDEPWALHRIAFKMRAENIPATLDFVKGVWERFVPHLPFGYWFLDESFTYLYWEEERLADMLSVFTGLAIFIACLGVFALVAFAAEQRTKEIGIRKVLGASVADIILLISREYTWLVLAANLLAWPVVYWAMGLWLHNFAYHVDVGVVALGVGGVLALLVAWLTVSWQAVKAARANPVEALRYE